MSQEDIFEIADEAIESLTYDGVLILTFSGNSRNSGFMDRKILKLGSSVLSFFNCPSLDTFFENFNDIIQKYTSLVWIWEKLPFPPIYLTYSMMVLCATFVVYVACKAAANTKPINAGPPDPNSKEYHHVDDTITNECDLSARVKKNLVKRLEKAQKMTRDVVSDSQELDIKFVSSDAYLSRYESALSKLRRYGQFSLGSVEALWIPVFSGGTLVSLYFLYKHFNPNNLDKVLRFYFVIRSFTSTTDILTMLIKYFTRKFSPKTIIPHWRITLANDNELNNTGLEPGYDKHEEELLKEEKKKKEKRREKARKKNAEASKVEVIDKTPKPKRQQAPKDMEICSPVEPKDQFFNFYFSLTDLITVPISVLFVLLHTFTNNWVFGNILAICVAIQGIIELHLESFKTGFIILGGLFVYDIFFVFGTDVMATVATQVDIPIKLEIPYPRPGTELNFSSPEYRENIWPTAILGLGDIVVPALYLTLCRQFDQYLYYEKHIKVVSKDKEDDEGDSLVAVSRVGLPYHIDRSYPKPYFTAGIIGYFIGLVVTVAVVHLFKTGQPALLYLCPAIAFSTLIIAYFRGELKQLFSFRTGGHDIDYDEDDTEDEDEEENENEKIEIKIESDDEN